MMPQNLPVVCAICSCVSAHTTWRARTSRRPPGAETARPADRLRSLSSLSPELGDSALCGDVFTLGGFAISSRTC